jgi:hypothetical protein
MWCLLDLRMRCTCELWFKLPGPRHVQVRVSCVPDISAVLPPCVDDLSAMVQQLQVLSAVTALVNNCTSEQTRPALVLKVDSPLQLAVTCRTNLLSIWEPSMVSCSAHIQGSYTRPNSSCQHLQHHMGDVPCQYFVFLVDSCRRSQCRYTSTSGTAHNQENVTIHRYITGCRTLLGFCEQIATSSLQFKQQLQWTCTYKQPQLICIVHWQSPLR